jgi:AcrR family transcriptional regulator
MTIQGSRQRRGKRPPPAARQKKKNAQRPTALEALFGSCYDRQEVWTLKNYANGLTTKNRILEACKDLFFQKGYIKTKYAEICEKAEVNPGSFSHHFKSKKNVASFLFDSMMEYYYERVAELFPGEDDLQQVMIAAGIHLKFLFIDERYRRFSSEFSSESIYADALETYIGHASKAYKVTLEYVHKKRADFLFTAYKGMDRFLELYINDHIGELSFDEVFEDIANIYYQYIKGSELKKRVGRALLLLNALDISFDHFEISIRMTKPGQ